MKKLLLILISFFILTGLVNNESPETEITCLAQNIYFESRDQKLKGQLGVALVTINRVKSKRFPNTFCKVVKQASKKNGKLVKHKCHFSWFCDGLPDTPRNKIAWKVSKVIAKAMLEQPGVHLKRHGERWKVNDFLNGATHYHRTDVDPYWNHKMLKVAEIGDHIFYIDPYRY